MQDEWKRIKALAFRQLELPKPLDDSNLICPTCGQTFPEEQIEQKKRDYEERIAKIKADYKKEGAEWQKAKDKNLADVSAEGSIVCDELHTLEASVKEYAQVEKDLRYNIEKTEEEYAAALKVEQTGNYDPEIVDPEYSVCMARIKQLSAEVEEADDKLFEMNAVSQEEQKKLDAAFDAINEKIALAKENKRIDEKILALQNNRMEMEQAKADAEMILYELDLLSRKKNDLLVEEINSHFKIVRFVLFEFLKNGNYSEVCIPTIDGKRFGESLNTGKEIAGRIDICETLQEFYGCRLPIILDNAESLNDFNVPKINSQMILLAVTEDKEIVFK